MTSDLRRWMTLVEARSLKNIYGNFLLNPSKIEFDNFYRNRETNLRSSPRFSGVAFYLDQSGDVALGAGIEGRSIDHSMIAHAFGLGAEAARGYITIDGNGFVEVWAQKSADRLSSKDSAKIEMIIHAVKNHPMLLRLAITWRLIVFNAGYEKMFDQPLGIMTEIAHRSSGNRRLLIMRQYIDAVDSLREGRKMAFPSTTENIAAAKAFVLAKWKERAMENGRDEPMDLSDACKFCSLFTSIVFGGKVKGNFFHQWTELPDGQRIDLADDAADVREMLRGEVPAGAKAYATAMRQSLPEPVYTHQERHMKGAGNLESMASIRPRVERWVHEFMGSRS